MKVYLTSFTSGKATLHPEDEPADYQLLANFAAKGAQTKPILIGASEGAGLSVLAATDPQKKEAIAGVIGLGLPRFSDNAAELDRRLMEAIEWVKQNTPR